MTAAFLAAAAFAWSLHGPGADHTAHALTHTLNERSKA